MTWTLLGLIVACCGWTTSILRNTDRAYRLKIIERQLEEVSEELVQLRERIRSEGEEWKNVYDEQDMEY